MSVRHLIMIFAQAWVLLFSHATAAQERGQLDAPPPRPLHERSDIEHSEPRRPEYASDDEMNWPMIIPSVAISGHIGFIDEEFDWPGVGLWLGANYYPWPDRYNAFWSMGIKLEHNRELRDRPYSVVPTLRSGFAALKGNPFKFRNQLFANVQIYGLVGRHIPVGGMPDFWRAGVGVISPRLVPANAAMLMWGVPLPNQLELVYDITPDGQNQEFLLMLGIGM